MGRIWRNGRFIERPEKVKEEMAHFFENLYTSDHFHKPSLDGVHFLSISPQIQTWMEREFETDEVDKVLRECEGDKAPGPNGFSFSVTKAEWEFLREDFYEMLTEFHSRGKLNREINATFLTLIATVPNLVKLRHYRPISLVDFVYKILAKV